MIYSSANINCLRHIYCNPDQLDKNWDKFKAQLNNDIEETIDAALDRKYYVYFNNLINKITDLFDEQHWERDSVVEGEKIYAYLVDREGDQLAHFLITLVSDLTHSFRHEILRLSEKGCEDLAAKHCEVIQQCLIESSNYSYREAGKKIKEVLCPDLKIELNARITSYVNERRERFFRAENDRREVFLQTIQKELATPDPNIRKLIVLVSRQVLFKNDWIDWLTLKEGEGLSLSEQNESLNDQNPYIKGLEVFQPDAHNPDEANQSRYTFNNPFFTAAFHTSLNETLEDVLLLLMRLHITQKINPTLTQRSTITITKMQNCGKHAFARHIDGIARLYEVQLMQRGEREKPYYFMAVNPYDRAVFSASSTTEKEL